MWNLLIKLYPLMTDEDCILMDDSQGEGPYISFWNINKLGPQPTKEFLKEHQEDQDIEDIRQLRLNELLLEKDLRMDGVVGSDIQREKNLIISRHLKLLYKKIKNKTSPEEDQELDDMETFSDTLDDIDSIHDSTERWLEDSLRTLVELESYDVSVDPSWPE